MIGHRIFTIGLVALLGAVTGCEATSGGEWRGRSPSHATHASVSIFYEDLAPYGHWFVYGSFGWVWTPYDVPYGWRPYTHGHWIYSDHGWTWVSHWRWGWAPFHYGRWVFDPDYGWIWIPGTVWGPAWVVWRWSDDWVGWAPLPPDADWQVGVGLRVGERHRRWDLDDFWWCFTSPRRLFDRDVRYKLEPPHRNRTLVERTRPVADYDEFEGRPRNRGRDIREVEKLAGRPAQRFKLVEARTPGEGERMLDRGQVRVFRPALQKEADARPPATKAPERPAATDEERLRREREERRLEQYYRDESARMKARQEEEARKAPRVNAEEVRRRQEAEQKALEEQKERERKVREQRIEKRIEKPAPARQPARKPPASEGRKKGN